MIEEQRGVVWTNKLEEDGSIEVVSVTLPGPSYLEWALTGGNTLHFTWTNANVKLQAQPNGLQSGDSNWCDYPGGDTSGLDVMIAQANQSVFLRLRSNRNHDRKTLTILPADGSMSQTIVLALTGSSG